MLIILPNCYFLPTENQIVIQSSEPSTEEFRFLEKAVAEHHGRFFKNEKGVEYTNYYFNFPAKLNLEAIFGHLNNAVNKFNALLLEQKQQLFTLEMPINGLSSSSSYSSSSAPQSSFQSLTVMPEQTNSHKEEKEAEEIEAQPQIKSRASHKATHHRPTRKKQPQPKKRRLKTLDPLDVAKRSRAKINDLFDAVEKVLRQDPEIAPLLNNDRKPCRRQILELSLQKFKNDAARRQVEEKQKEPTPPQQSSTAILATSPPVEPNSIAINFNPFPSPPPLHLISNYRGSLFNTSAQPAVSTQQEELLEYNGNLLDFLMDDGSSHHQKP